MATDGSESKSDAHDIRDLQIKILLHEHKMIRGEVLLMMTQYKNHIRVLQLSATGIVAIVSWYITKSDVANETIKANWGLSWGVVFMIPLLCGYMIFDILHAIYSMTLLGARTEKIENQISKLAGPNLLLWEKIAKVFFSKWRPGGVYNPLWAHAALTLLVISAFMLGVPWYGYEILLTTPHKVGICNPEWWITFGKWSAVAIVGVCVFYGWEVLRKMRLKADTFVAGVMTEQTRIYVENTVK